MITFVLEEPYDIGFVLRQIDDGRTIRVVAGEHRRRPKTHLLQDAVRAAVHHGANVHDPIWVTRGLLRRDCLMQSCVLAPESPHGDPAGVREPRRRPPSAPPTSAGLDLPDQDFNQAS